MDPENSMSVRLFVILITHYNININDVLISSCSGFQQGNLYIHTAS